MTSTGYVQVGPDFSGGKKVNNLVVTTRIQNSDGSVTDENRYVQLISITDQDGTTINLMEPITQVLAELDEIRRCLSVLTQITAEVNNMKDRSFASLMAMADDLTLDEM
jgi:hypothetical protein